MGREINNFMISLGLKKIQYLLTLYKLINDLKKRIEHI
ncbi:MAG: hypothetical protein K0S63_1287 [Gammaproteobacteria bacterium]|nr:hypothetical protein [Gammaproteobacteria bacterium]